MGERIVSVAVDGPAGSGKSTISKLAAKILGFEYIDTGAMYRALTLKVLNKGLNPQKPEEVVSLLKDTDIDFVDNHIYLDGEMVDETIRQNIISQNVSYIAAIKEVREAMVRIQQNLAKAKSIIMDGRDIITVVLPDADFKIFVTASVEERSRRRYKELLEKGETNITLEQIMKDIERRDYIDSNREIAPLVRTEGSYLLDTTNNTIDESVNFIVSLVKRGL
ncbi:(d)CMP kinase [Tissierella creatinini]|nr:(d)CMP kinase [Tissierella creatinini]TJX69118.1 (d)CMP kinase [Soehngenia saccharolytica]